jgi:hypothetical protein
MNPLNYDGYKYPVRGGDMRRAHRALIEFKGVELKVEGQDVTRLLEEFRDEIAMAVEASWDAV